MTTYFRTAFTVNDPQDFTSLQLALLRDDGAVVYLNGTEIERSNMPGSSDHLTLAQSTISGAGETTFSYSAVPPALLVAGTNILAAEVHQVTLNSPDISFDAELTGVAASDENSAIISTAPACTYTVSDAATLTAVFEPGDERLAPAIVTQQMAMARPCQPFCRRRHRVESNASLTIGPGVELHMPQSACIYVYGELHIDGSTNTPC